MPWTLADDSDMAEWERMAKYLSKKYPLAGSHLEKM